MEKESFEKLESMDCEIEDLKDMVALMLEECFVFNDNKLDDYEIRYKYRTAQTLTNAIFKLLYYVTEDSRTFINKVYAERKAMKAGGQDVHN